MLGMDLGKALDDRNHALPRFGFNDNATYAGFLETRGLVHLRMGELDLAIADLSADYFDRHGIAP
jgi:hypothetical protein